MKWSVIVAVFLAATLSAQAAGADAVYQYTGNPFTQFSCGPAEGGEGTILCSTPAPTNTETSYLATDFVSATLTFDEALPPSLTLQNVANRPGAALTMTDGHQTLTIADAAGLAIEVATDANGEIVQWRLIINTGGALNGGISTINTTSVADTGVLACCHPGVPGDLGTRAGAAGTWNSSGVRCEIVLNGTTFGNGQLVTASVIRFANTSETPTAVEVKVWLDSPTFAPVSVINAGATGSAVLPAGADINIGPKPLFTVNANFPRGTYGFSCRLLNPVTGKQQSESLKSFVIQ